MMDLQNLKPEDLKLVVTDIDFTLTDKTRLLRKETVAVIKRLREHGVKFALASGRPLDELEILVNNWDCPKDIFDFYIGMNGGELKDFQNNKVDEFFKMAPEHLKEILELMEPLDINPCVYYHGNVLCKRVDEYVTFSVQRTNKKIILYKDISEMYSEPNAKIMFRVDPKKMDECEAYGKAHPSPYWNVFRTGSFNLEFSDSRINKAYPLGIIAERYGFTIDNVMAFGDTSNDNEMLQQAGWGVCLLNGTADTKACSNDVTDLTVEEQGVADYITKHVLNKLGW